MANSIADQLIGVVAQGNSQMGSNIQTGAQLAQGIQQVVDRRKELEMKKQELEMKKDEDLANSFETIGKIKSPTMRKIYIEKVLGNKLKALGREDMFDPAVFEAIQKGDQESINRILNGLTSVRNGQMDLATFKQSLKNADDFVTLESYEPEFLKAQEAAQDFRERKAVAAASNPNSRLTDQFNKRELRTLNNDVRSTFKPIADKRTALRNASDSLDKVFADIKAGKKESSIDFNSAVRGVAKAFNSGAMSDSDVDDFRRQTGIEDITEANVKKWITGGAPREALTAVSGIVKRSAANLDTQAKTAAEAFEGRLNMFDDPEEARKVSGLNAYLKPTLKTPGSGAFTVSAEQKAKFKAMTPEKQEANAKALADKLGRTVEEIKEAMK